jgi:hypothetical protein
LGNLAGRFVVENQALVIHGQDPCLPILFPFLVGWTPLAARIPDDGIPLNGTVGEGVMKKRRADANCQ